MQISRNAVSGQYFFGTLEHGLVASLKQALANRRTDQARRRVVRATVDALSKADDATLADLGLHRSGIRAVAEDVANRVKR